MGIEFRILGPLEMSADGRVLPLGSPKQRALLALLLVHANETLSRDRVIEELWAETAPATVESAFHSYLSRLRRLLEGAGAGDLLVREAHGYRLRVAPDQLDANRFEGLVSAGSEGLAAGKFEVAADRLRQALALWRGPALADVQSERFAITASARLEEARVSALEQRLEADLALGRHGRLIGELETLVAAHPYRERLRAQLMLTLYRCGRQAEALRAYQEARRALADELGLEPGQELKELEQAILRQAATLRLDRAELATEPEASLPAPAAVAPPREERKVVSVLFADLVAFSERAERLDPEDVRAIQDRYWAPVRAEIERHGGTVEKFVGDAVMALFGAPRAHEDDPERAVRAALAIREWAREEGLEVRIAVTSGEALVRLGAQPLAGEGTAAGDVINTAARLQAAAPVNGILVDNRTFRATRHLIDYREGASVPRKGSAELIPACEALEARSRFGVDILHHRRTPLVGRERELELLRSTLVRTREERAPQLVTLVGVPGIGKSRLVHELMQAIGDDPSGLVTWRQGRSLPYGDGASFWALAEIVKAQAAILESDTDTEAQAKLMRSVQVLIDDAAEAGWVERHLRPLAGLGGDGESSGERQNEVFASWRRFVEALADWRPAVLVFEDLHWADGDLLDFVDSLVEWVTNVPLLVVATARPELLDRRPAWGGGKANATTLSLSPLSEDETLRLVRGLVERKQLPANAEEALVERAAGNALYAEQYVRMWEERVDAEQLPLPETVHGLIAARLDGLSATEKSVLQSAAVFGKVFWQGAIVAVDGLDAGTAAECLHALQRKQFVQRARRSSVAAETEYAFLHVLVRDVAYGQILRAARAGKHERAAAWIESLGRVEDHAEMLAHHYLSAFELASATGRADEGLTAQAVESLIRAGERASALNAFPSAAAYEERALQMLPEDDSRRPQVLFGYARALFASGNERRATALEQARTALLSAGDIDAAAEADTLLAEVAWYEDGRRAAIDTHLERAVTLIHDRALSPSKARVLAAVARFRMLAFDRSAVEVAREALALAEALDLHDVQAEALITLGTARYEQGEIGGSSDIERGLQMALDHNALSAALRACNNLARQMNAKGEDTRQIELLKQAERLAERLGDPHQLRFARSRLITSEFVHGRWDEALRRADDFIAECNAELPAEESRVRMEPRVRGTRAEIRLARDDEEGAIADCERALAIARKRGSPQDLVPVLTHGIYLYVRLGRLDEARTFVTEVLSYDAALVARYPLLWLALDKEPLGLSPQHLNPYLAHMPTELPWHELAELMLSGEYERAAERIGNRNDIQWEAEVRRRAGEQFLRTGRHDEANEQLLRALAFYRSVGATRYIREVEALLAANGSETETATPHSRT
jgi:predicted ATPase/DNA-binding SARP family transcriptional activator